MVLFVITIHFCLLIYRENLDGKLKGRHHSEDLGIDGKINIMWILGRYCPKAWTGCIWLRIETSGGML
jgi:hypothetical protein